MRGIILAAGRGSRMGKLTNTGPKCLIEFRNRKLIDWQIDSLKQSGVSKILIVAGYLGEQLGEYNAELRLNKSWSTTNMVYSLTLAEDWLKSYDCIISYSDIIYERTAVENLMTSENDFSVSYDRKWLELWNSRFEDPLSDAESFKLDDKSNLVSIGGRANHVNDIEGQYMGLLKSSPAGWLRIREFMNTMEKSIVEKLDMTSLLSLIINSGTLNIEAIEADCMWFEFDSEQDLCKGDKFLPANMI